MGNRSLLISNHLLQVQKNERIFLEFEEARGIIGAGLMWESLPFDQWGEKGSIRGLTIKTKE